MSEPVRITFHLQDDHGDLQSVPIFIAGASTEADAQAQANAYAAVLDAVTGALIVNYDVTLPLTRAGGLKSSVTPDSWHDNGAIYAYRQADLNLRSSTRIPAIPPALIASGALITATGALAALVAAIDSQAPAAYHSRQGNSLTTFIGWKRSKSKIIT